MKTLLMSTFVLAAGLMAWDAGAACAYRSVESRHELMSTLGKEVRETALLVYGLGLTHSEAAKKLGVTPETVSRRLNRMGKVISSSKNCWPGLVETNPKPPAP